MLDIIIFIDNPLLRCSNTENDVIELLLWFIHSFIQQTPPVCLTIFYKINK